MSRPYDHTAFAAKLELLVKFQREHGHTNVPWDHPDKSLFNWVTAQKRAYAAGKLTQERNAMLAELGFVFPVGRGDPPGNTKPPAVGEPYEPTPADSAVLAAQEDARFDANLQQLSQWLDEKESTTGLRNLVYRDTQISEVARTAYRFVEQIALHAQQGRLPDTHRTRLMMLAFSVNGRSIDAFLPFGTGCGATEGVSLSRNDHQLTDAKPIIAATSSDVQRPVARESSYLTTEELARRLNYDPRTIREVLKDRVLVEKRHYLRPFGRRKILWIWDAIEADIRNGLCKISTHSVDPEARQDPLCRAVEV